MEWKYRQRNFKKTRNITILNITCYDLYNDDNLH